MQSPVPNSIPLLLIALSDARERTLVAARLERAGFAVAEAQDGGVPLPTLCEQLVPELVIVDAQRAPRSLMNDVEPAPNEPATPYGYLIVVDEKDADRALDTRAIDWITRPFPINLFVRRVRQALRTQRVVRERDEARATRARLEAELAKLGRSAPAAAPAERTSAFPLAALPDREQFLQLLAHAIATAKQPREQVAVLYIHLDPDAALAAQAAAPAQHDTCATLVQRMKDCLRERDAVGIPADELRDAQLAQMRADEFTILLPGLSNAQDAYKIGRRLQATISAPLTLDGRECTPSSSLGIATHPADSSTPAALLDAAEAAMQRARQLESNGIQFHTPAMNRSAFEKLTLEASLRGALERDELLVYYQPKVEISTNRIVGFEALVRWMHPQLGMVSPAQFIPIAEETGLIVELGERVLKKACAQTVAWQRQGLPQVRMAVNLSTVQFHHAQLKDSIARVLEQTGLSPELLELELTESILLQKADTIIATLHGLKKMGIHLSIDDFGTGYSSLSYLRRFPIDSLKIDQSFIREVLSNPEDASITTSIILMGKSLKLHVVAEGVETRNQLAFLKVLECDEAQGYLFSRPVPADEARELLVNGVDAILAG